MRLIVANYKMNGDKKFFRSVNLLNRLKLKDTTLVLCPPFVYLSTLKIKNKKISLGAQDLTNMQDKKPTGEISPNMLNDYGVKYVIVGHSERRAMGETDEIVARKVENALNAGLIPIICVGEPRIEDGLGIVKTQVNSVLSYLKKCNLMDREMIFAYEPIWAIGSGVVPSVSQINKAIKLIRASKKGFSFKVLYGGSVNGNNYREVSKSEADGFLLGGVSLKLDEFKSIVKGVD